MSGYAEGTPPAAVAIVLFLDQKFKIDMGGGEIP
jgi:hypothetical protein